MTDASDQPIEPSPDEKVRIDRRTAMKAALGGAVVAAAWSAPKIEGLSLSPDYASAASVRPVTNPWVNAHPSSNGGAYSVIECVGNNVGLNNCGDYHAPALALAGPTNGEVFTLNATLGGQVKNNGQTYIKLTGINNASYSCAVNISGTCTPDNGNAGLNTPANFNGVGTYTLSKNVPDKTVSTTCSGPLLYYKTTITLNVDCTY